VSNIFKIETQEDYKLLEKLNDVTALKYTDMSKIAENVGKNMTALNEKCV